MKLKHITLTPGQTVTLKDSRQLQLDRVDRPWPHCPPDQIKLVCGRRRIPLTHLAEWDRFTGVSWTKTEDQILADLKQRRRQGEASPYFCEPDGAGGNTYVTLAPRGRARLARYSLAQWLALGHTR